MRVLPPFFASYYLERSSESADGSSGSIKSSGTMSCMSHAYSAQYLKSIVAIIYCNHGSVLSRSRIPASRWLTAVHSILSLKLAKLHMGEEWIGISDYNCNTATVLEKRSFFPLLDLLTFSHTSIPSHYILVIFFSLVLCPHSCRPAHDW